MKVLVRGNICAFYLFFPLFLFIFYFDWFFEDVFPSHFCLKCAKMSDSLRAKSSHVQTVYSPCSLLSSATCNPRSSPFPLFPFNPHLKSLSCLRYYHSNPLGSSTFPILSSLSFLLPRSLGIVYGRIFPSGIEHSSYNSTIHLI